MKKFLIIGLFLTLILFPVFFYVLIDVDKLQDQYPHLSLDKEEVSYIIQKNRPKYWVSLSSISKYASWAIIISEDWSFYQHDGIDVEQIKLAFNEMLDANRFRGASTITQQMIKNIYLLGYWTSVRKFLEIALAYKIEQNVPKKRILEIYLNSIEFGPGIYGIKAAASHYFKKHPSTLTAREGAFFAMLLPSPKRYYISFKKKKLTGFAQERVKWTLKKMRMAKVITPSQFESELNSRFFWELN
jgi:monofunctional biosynthetic peptidoglycan transglycosylase